MKRCYLAALAMTWYLLVPPPVGDRGVNSGAPVSTWSKAGEYQSESDCAQAKRNFAGVIRGQANSSLGLQAVLALQGSKCIASNDYRLEAAQNPAVSSAQNPAAGFAQNPAAGSH
jgi:hypothetical protein